MNRINYFEELRKMKPVIIIAIAFVLLIPLSANGQLGYVPDAEDHQRILEEGYSTNDILAMIVLAIIGVVITAVFLNPKMRKKFSNYGEKEK